MKRRSLLAAGFAAPLVSPLAALPASAQAKGITVVNVAAWNCPYCVKWTNEYKQAWVASPEYKKVRYVEIDSPTIKQAYNAEYWKDDMKAVLDKMKNKGGTPRFLLVRNGAIVFNEFGMSGWPNLLAKLKPMLA